MMILLLIQCHRNSETSRNLVLPFSLATALDSIAKLDSLVSAKKVSDNQQSRQLSRKAITIATKIQSETALAKAYLMMGVACGNPDEDSAFIFYTKSLKLAEKNKLLSIIPNLYYNIAMVYQEASDAKSSILYLDSCIASASKVKEYRLLSDALITLGVIKLDAFDSLHAKELFDSSYRIARRYSLDKQSGVNLANLSKFEKDPIVINRMQRHSIEFLSRIPGNEEEIAMILINIGTRCSNPDSAIAYFQSANKIGQAGHSSLVQIAASNNLAYSFLDKKDFRNAEFCLVNMGIPLAIKTSNFSWLSTLYDTYADVLFAQKKTDKAFQCERKALQAGKEAYHQQATGQVRLLASLLELNSKEATIHEKEAEVQLKTNKINQISVWFVLSMLILVAIIFAVVWKLQRNKINNQKSLIESAKKLIASEENLKGRVSMELHDLTTPFYTSILQQIEAARIDNPQIEEQLKGKLALLAASLRQISHRLSTTFIEQLSINELVVGLCKDIQGLTKIPIHCVMGQDSFNLTNDESLHIYRIVQELLTNALKYVTFGEIRLSLSQEAGMFFILYKDTGSGFDAKAGKEHGLGVVNICERAKIIDGKAILTTAPGKGTQWSIVITLANKGKERTQKLNT